ncbi:MAG TPA: VWA domain-containing protein [Vicinamibacterales bacterium]|nr:VWA domain-containing protein [Vicinamibacterales bacterium]
MGIRSALSCIVLACVYTFQAPQTPVEPRPGRLLIDAVVVDRAGMPVLDVKPSELEVWLVGYRIPIESVTFVNPTLGVPSNRSIALLLDDINVDPAVMPRARDAARQFVNRMVPNDRIAVATLSGAVLEPNADRARLLQRIDAYAPHAWSVDRLDTMGAHVLNTVTAVSRLIGQTTGGRKAIVALGAAGLFDTPIPPPTVGRDLRPEWVNAMRAMASANIALYVIDPAGVGGTRTTGGESGFARETGGMAFINTNDLTGVADRIMRESGSYYLIELRDPPMGREMDLRALDVRVLRPGLSVRARRAVPGAR